jgi:hypothetical protein
MENFFFENLKASFEIYVTKCSSYFHIGTLMSKEVFKPKK